MPFARRFFPLLILALLLAACQSTSPSQTPTVMVIPTSPPPLPSNTPRAYPPTEIPTITAIATSTHFPTGTPANTPTQEQTSTKTHQPTDTPPPTPTPLPPSPLPPTPLPLSSHPLLQPATPISLINADQVTQLALWGKGLLRSISYSPDGRTLAVATSIGVYVYETGTWEQMHFLKAGAPVDHLAFSPDGIQLVTGGDDIIQLWHMSDGALLYTVGGHRPEALPRGVTGLAFSSDGKTIVSISYNNKLRLWQSSDGELLRTLEGPGGWLSNAALSPGTSPEEMILASTSGKDLRLWSVMEETLLRTLKGITWWSRGLAFSSDGTLLASVAGNNVVWLWQVSNGTSPHELPGGATGLAFSPDGVTLATSSVEHVVRLWRVKDGTHFHTLEGHTDSVYDVAFSPNGKTLASAAADATVRLWKVESWSPLHILRGYTERPLSSLALSPDDTILAVGSWDGAVRLWQLSNGALLGTMRGHIGSVSSIAFSPDGKAILVSGSRDSRLRLWRVEDSELLYAQRGRAGTMRSGAFSPDGALLVSAGNEGQVLLWQAESGELMETLQGFRSDVNSVAFSPDGTMVAAGLSYGTLELWQVERGELLASLAMNGQEVTSVVFSPDGTVVAAAIGPKVWLWQTANRTPQRVLTAPEGNLQRVTFSNDGKILASGADDGAVRLWRIADGVLLHTLEGHMAPVTDVAFAHDDTFLVSSAEDGTVRFWGVSPTPEAAPTPAFTPVPTPTHTYAGHLRLITSQDGLPTGEIHHLWVAPDGRLWLSTDSGIFVQTDDGLSQIFDGLANRVLGIDGAQRVWAVVNAGWQVAAYIPAATSGDSSGSWTLYGPDRGWIRGYGSKPISDRQGRVWMATGDDLRRFDPQMGTWTIYKPTDIGFEPMADSPDLVLSITAVALDSAGNVWVGSCTQQGILISGQGVRWFDGERWSGSADTAGECVHGIEVDDAGRVWMSGFDALIQYDPSAQAWSRIPLPPWERPQLITSLTLDAAQNPWVTFTRFGPTGPWHSNALYHLENGVWMADYDPGHDMPFHWDLGADGSAWVCDLGAVLQLVKGGQQEIGAVGFCEQIAVDGVGRVWVDSVTGLWLWEP